MTDPIKSKIQELCPDVMEKEYILRTTRSDGSRHSGGFVPFPITLAVVLRAVKKECLASGIGHDTYFKAVVGVVGKWSEHDTYDQQSEETKQFIGSLLGV